MPPDVFERYLPILFALPLFWGFAVVVASIVYRRSHGKPILFGPVERAAFTERSASGHSNRTWYTKLGGARRCLVVTVADGRLIIRPQFPFNLMFLPEIYGLEYEVPLEQIIHVELRAGWFGHVRLEFRDQVGQLQDVTLYLRQPQEFVNAVGRPATSG